MDAICMNEEVFTTNVYYFNRRLVTTYYITQANAMLSIKFSCILQGILGKFRFLEENFSGVELIPQY